LGTFADFYAKGDFPNAMKELERNREKISPGLWHFNMGIVKAKLMMPAEARFHFLEAHLKGFTNEKLAQNESLVEDELEVKTLEKPLDTMDYAVKFGLWAQNGFFTMISLMFLLGGLLILKKQRKYSILVLTVVMALVPVGISYWVKTWDKFVNVVPLQVMDGPSVIFGSRGELPAGILLITRRSGDWSEVVYPSRFRGWIRNTGLKELE
jgi:hypothetical protein